MTATRWRAIRPTALLVVAGLLLASSAASASWQGNLTASGVQAVGASASEGDLAVVLQELTRPSHQPGHPDFRLDAEHLRVESDHAALSLRTPVTEVRDDPQRQVREHDHATVVGTLHRDEYQFSVWPIAGATVEAGDAGCASLRPSEEDVIDRTPLVAGATRPSNIAPVGDALEWSGCLDADLTVRGDFLLRLWEWDAELSADGETTPLPSGRHDQDGEFPDTTGHVERATEQYLYAYNATLTIPRLTGSYQVYLGAVDVQADGFQLRDARGEIQGVRSISVDGEDIYLQGDGLEIRSQNGGGVVAATFRGGLQKVHVDGVAATIAAPEILPDGSGLLFGGLLATVLVGAVWRQAPLIVYQANRSVGGYQGSLLPNNRRERRAVGLWVLARMDRRFGWYRRCRRHAERAHRLFPLFGEARLTAAVAKAHMGHHGEALLDFEDAYPCINDAAMRAVAACGAASAACHLGEAGRAREWLMVAAEEDEQVFRQRIEHPSYEALSGETWFHHLRSRSTLRGGHDPAIN